MKVKSFVILSGIKISFARQFIEISKKKLFEKITIFTRVFDSKINTIDLDDTRYIYLNLKEEIYLVLICEKNYNIFTGLDLLKQIYRAVMNINPDLEKSKHFDLVLAIDDIIEGETVASALEGLKMYSSDELTYKQQAKEKEDIARDNMIKGIEEIERLKYNNMYIDNSVSEEKIRENAEMERRGMDLKQLLIEKLIENEEERLISKFF
jgi:hypothetical protein